MRRTEVAAAVSGDRGGPGHPADHRGRRMVRAAGAARAVGV